MTRHPLIVFFWLFFGLFHADAHALETAAKTAPEPADVKSVISTLENQETRERLIGQLKLLVQTQQEMDRSKETPTLGETAIDLLKTLSDRVAKFVETTVKAATMFYEIPSVAGWLERQSSNLERRNLWLAIIENLAAIMGSAYLAFFIARWLLERLSGVSERRAVEGRSMRISYLFVSLLFASLAIIVFAIAAHVMIGFIQPAGSIRLVTIAWINAAVVARTIIEINRFFFAPQFPQFRFLPVSDKQALYADRWMQCLSVTGAYGHFILQAAFQLGMPQPLYETLLRLFGLLMTVLIMVIILQNRRSVAQFIRGVETIEARELHPRHILRRLASVWHAVAIIYVLMLYMIWALDLADGSFYVLKGTLLTVLILITGNAIAWSIERVFSRGFRIGEASRQRFPSLENRFNRYLPVLLASVKGLIYLLMILVVFQAWGVSTFAWLTTRLVKTFGGEIARIGGIILVTLLVWEATTLLMESFLSSAAGKKNGKQPSARLRTLLSVAQNALFIVLISMSVMIVLSDVGIDIAPLLAGAGVVGVAVGFGAQKLVQDIITGMFILIENLISVGDVVSVGGKDGLVEAISIRTVRLRDLAGNVHTIPFSSIGPITNMTREFSYYVFDVGVSYREDVDGVMDELAAIGQEMMQDPRYASLILEPLEILGVDSFASSAVMIKARIKTLPIKQWDVGREFNRRMKRRFDQLAIEMSLPRLSIYRQGSRKDRPQPEIIKR